MFPKPELERPWRDSSKGAILSPDRLYRWALWRIWDRQRRLLCFVCLNGSTADEEEDDHSLRKFIGFANTLNAGGVLVGNAFGYRTPYPRLLRKAAEPIGAENDKWVRLMSADAGETIVAWGNHGAHLKRSSNMTPLLSEPVSCFGYTKTGEPKHPLYLSYDEKLIPFGVGDKGFRDGHAICRGFDPGLPAGDCDSDGHYLCFECKCKKELEEEEV